MINSIPDSWLPHALRIALRRGAWALLVIALYLLPGCRKRSVEPSVRYHTATFSIDPSAAGGAYRLWVYNSREALVRQIPAVETATQLSLPAGRYSVVAATDDSDHFFWSGIGVFSQLRMYMRQVAVGAKSRAEQLPVVCPTPFATTRDELDMSRGAARLDMTPEQRLKQLRIRLLLEPDALQRLPMSCDVEVSGLSATFCLSTQRVLPGDDVHHAVRFTPSATNALEFAGVMPLMGNDTEHKSTLLMTVHYQEGWSRTSFVDIDEQLEALDEADKVNINVEMKTDTGFSAEITDWEVVEGEFPVH